MRHYTIEYQRGTGDERDGWTVVGSEIAQLHEPKWTAEKVAEMAAMAPKTVLLGEHWRVVVWEGAWPERPRPDSAAEFYADMLPQEASAQAAGEE